MVLLSRLGRQDEQRVDRDAGGDDLEVEVRPGRQASHPHATDDLTGDVFVAAFSFGGSYALYKLTDLIIPLRVSPDQEELGLDLSQHGEIMQEVVAAAPEPRLARTA